MPTICPGKARMVVRAQRGLRHRRVRPQLEADKHESNGSISGIRVPMGGHFADELDGCVAVVLSRHQLGQSVVRDERSRCRQAQAESAQMIPWLIDRGELELAMGLMGAVSQRRIMEASQIIRRFLQQVVSRPGSEAQLTWGKLVLCRALRLLLSANPGEVASEHSKMVEEMLRSGHKQLGRLYREFIDPKRRCLRLKRVKSFLREQALVLRDGGNLKEAMETMDAAVGPELAESELGLSREDARFNRVPEGD